MKRKAKIICTLGPATERKAVIAKLADAGADMVRINFSHADHAYHLKVINAVRAVNKTRRKKVKILQDLEGYRIRLGYLGKPILLQKGQIFWMSIGKQQSSKHIPLEADFDMKLVKKGMEIFIADGMIALKVISGSAQKAKVQVVHGGMISSKKGVNIPGLRLQANILTEKDKADIAFGIEHKMDLIALSFVRNKQDVLRVARLVKPYLPKCRIIAKIENAQGLKNLDSIIDVSDGVIVARGDLGVCLPIYQLPMIQKEIIRHCNKHKKCVMTATQMLESMTEHLRPTRAEVTDVANAILDGTDFVMLSGETAIGKFPVQAVKMMRQVIEFTERNITRNNAKHYAKQR